MSDITRQPTPGQERLRLLVAEAVERDGQLFEGYTWAVRPYAEWASLALMDVRTVQRHFGASPYDTLRKRVEGKQATLVRIGVPNPNQSSRLAATMAKLFRDQTGHKVSPRAYGCLHGLVQDWRPGWQLEIFRHAISPEGWAMTKALSKYHTEDLVSPLGKGGTVKLLPGKAHLFQQFPHIPTLRLFWKCAEAAFVESRLNQNAAQQNAAQNDPFWLSWSSETEAQKLLEWIPQFKAKADPIMGKTA